MCTRGTCEYPPVLYPVPTSTVPSTDQYCTQYRPVLYPVPTSTVQRCVRAGDRKQEEQVMPRCPAPPAPNSSSCYLIKTPQIPRQQVFLTQRMKNIFPLPRSTWIIQSCISLQRSRPNWPHAHICTQSATESVTITRIKTMLNFLLLVFVVFSCFWVHVLCDFNRVHHISHLPEKFSPQLSPFTTTGEWMNLNCHKNLQTTSWTMWF